METIATISEHLRSSTAAERLAEHGDKVVEPLIWILLHESCITLRRYAATALGKIGDTRAIDPLARVLRQDEPLVREHAAEALGYMGDTRVVRPLLRALNDPTSVVRKLAERALVRIGSPAVIPLIQELWDPRTRIHDSAIETLVQIGPPAVGSLRNTLQYGGTTERRDAMTILKRMGDGQTLPRRLLADNRLSPCQKAEDLAFLLPFYRLPNIRPYCRHLLHDMNERVQQGAWEVLSELDRRVLVRPATTDQAELLRPATTRYEELPHTLLRATEQDTPPVSTSPVRTIFPPLRRLLRVSTRRHP